MPRPVSSELSIPATGWDSVPIKFVTGTTNKHSPRDVNRCFTRLMKERVLPTAVTEPHSEPQVRVVTAQQSHKFDNHHLFDTTEP